MNYNKHITNNKHNRNNKHKCNEYYSHNINKIGTRRYGSLFIIWLILVIMIILIFIMYQLSDRLLSVCDFRSYIPPISPILPIELSVNDVYSLNCLSSQKLLTLSSGHIPNIVDFIEDDVKILV